MRSGLFTALVIPSQSRRVGATGYEVLGVDEKNELTRVAGGKAEECKVTVDLPLSSVRLARLAKEKPGK